MPKKTSPSTSKTLGGQHRNHPIRDIQAAKHEWSQRLLRRPSMPALRRLTSAITPDPEHNLVGVGIGEKIVAGQHTGVMAVKFLVRAKYHESHISRSHLLPKSISGVPADVEQVGLFRRFAAAPSYPPMAAVTPNPRTKIRPAQPGSSVGFADPSNQFPLAGTFGALVNGPLGTCILSNNHVLADEGLLPLNSPIFQPGLLDGGNTATDQVAHLSTFIPLQSGVTNSVDCALAKVVNPADVSNEILQIGAPQGVAPAQIDMTVHKFGRTTQYTAGQVTSIDTDVSVQYDTGTLTFGGQIIVVGLQNQPFSGAGDSGSLILERGSNAAVGLLFAGSDSHTIANHIQDVLAALNATLA